MTPRIPSWPPRRFPFRTRLSTGEVVPIRGRKHRERPTLRGAVCVDLSLYVSPDGDYYGRVETLIHEFVHLAEEEMLRDGVIGRRMSEKRVEAMGVHLTRYLAEAAMLRGLPERVTWEQPMLPFEEGEDDV